ncbi:HD domain-containing protein [Acetobacteraceae bacterium]|nr:HD domain-containing protein [Candidatus Parcubacteria bacterium]
MTRIENLRTEVKNLYKLRHPNRARWADWIYEGHVLPVGNASRAVAQRFGGDPELAEAAGLLHDVADSIMKREESEHEAKSMEIAKELLKKVGYSNAEISIVVDDALLYHSCRGDDRPKTLEGKAMAAGDAVAHLTTNFYLVAEEGRREFQTPEEIFAWVNPKLDRDFTNKIAYDELREEIRLDYEKLKSHFQ